MMFFLHHISSSLTILLRARTNSPGLGIIRQLQIIFFRKRHTEKLVIIGLPRSDDSNFYFL